MTRLGVRDYPLAETRPEAIRGKRGLALQDITLAAVLAGEVTMEDLQITPKALQDQAEIAADAGRATLALNFARAAELVDVPQDLIMSTYELLRPGRARLKQELYDRAALLRTRYAALQIAAFIEEAADIYEKRGLFAARY
jgi:propanediol dehydratase small subunit